jgi:uncharacterized membrane protein
MTPQLRRSETDRMIAGVAGGFSVLLYLILWIALPNSPAHIPATQIAAERYVRGEISAVELERLRNDLQAAG